MKHLFIPYELAVMAKEKGFNEPCLAYYVNDSQKFRFVKYLSVFHFKNTNNEKKLIAAPTNQQITDWFRENHKLHIIINPYGDLESWAISNIVRIDKKDFFQRVNLVIREKYAFVRFNSYYEALNTAIEEAFLFI